MNTSITETILAACDGSTTELARRLTLASDGGYFTTNQVSHWCKVKRVPPEHALVVSQAFDLRVEDVVPQLFKAQNNNN